TPPSSGVSPVSVDDPWLKAVAGRRGVTPAELKRTIDESAAQTERRFAALPKQLVPAKVIAEFETAFDELDRSAAAAVHLAMLNGFVIQHDCDAFGNWDD